MKKIEIIDYFPAYDISLVWYKDPLTVKMVDGVQKAYELDDLIRMYSYLSKHGDLFYLAMMISLLVIVLFLMIIWLPLFLIRIIGARVLVLLL